MFIYSFELHWSGGMAFSYAVSETARAEVRIIVVK